MGILKPGAGLAMLVVAGAVALAPGSPLKQTALELDDDGGASRFRVLASGSDTGCELGVPGPAETAETGRLQLELGGGCAAEEMLSGLRYWSDNPDGTIELTDERGFVAVRLAAGDGSAFEAFGAGAPLITLIDAR